MRAARTLPALALVALAACQSADVGQRCDIGLDPATYNPTSIPSELLQTFNPVCDNLVCLMSPLAEGDDYSDCPSGSLCGYCSKPCVSDQDCFKSETGLVCRQIVLDREFIDSLPPEAVETYLAGVTNTSYCAVPQG
jgi:hypothetical protein